MFFPATAQQLDTKVYIHVVSLLHVSASPCHYQEVFDKKHDIGYRCYRCAIVRSRIYV